MDITEKNLLRFGMQNIYAKSVNILMTKMFPYKTVIPEANPKTNKMVTTKWTYDKERSFTSNYFIFLKFLF